MHQSFLPKNVLRGLGVAVAVIELAKRLAWGPRTRVRLTACGSCSIGGAFGLSRGRSDRGDPLTWSARLKDFMKGVLVLVALVASVGAAIGLLTFLKHTSCDRLDAERVSFLEPGHDTPGPGSIFVKGVGPGPPKSEIVPYLEAEAAMTRAGCYVPALVGPS